jgi:hypothetical protein
LKQSGTWVIAGASEDGSEEPDQGYGAVYILLGINEGDEDVTGIVAPSLRVLELLGGQAEVRRVRRAR